jgi:hypothetical protein
VWGDRISIAQALEEGKRRTVLRLDRAGGEPFLRTSKSLRCIATAR